mgnify:CR=1 FL=1
MQKLKSLDKFKVQGSKAIGSEFVYLRNLKIWLWATMEIKQKHHELILEGEEDIKAGRTYSLKEARKMVDN